MTTSNSSPIAPGAPLPENLASRASRREDWLATAEACRTRTDLRAALGWLIEEAYGEPMAS